MQAKTKLQHQINDIKDQLKPISQKEIDWANQKLFGSYVGYTYKKSHHCLECGHSWKADTKGKKVDCPSCKVLLTPLEDFKKRNYTFSYYVSKIDRVGDFQVIRMFMCQKHLHKNQKPTFSFHEVFQDWMTPQGKIERLSLPVKGMSWYYDDWNYGEELEFRSKSKNQNARLREGISPSLILKSKKSIKTLKRNGFKGYFHGVSPRFLFSNLLTNSKFETLFKAKRIDFINYMYYNADLSILKYWKSIKVVMKNNYPISDVSLWKDYVSLLDFFNKDLTNVKYVCPADLKAEHDRYMKRKNRQIMILKAKEREKNIKAYNEIYQKEKSSFFGLSFTESDLTIEPFKNVKQFYNEGLELNHCIFTNEYFAKKDKLILSAKINGVVTETIELDLNTFKILQARGKSNVLTKHNARIISLIENNVDQIQKIAKAS